MNCFSVLSKMYLCLLIITALSLAPVVSAQDKPALSEEIRTVIETEGVDAAKQRFDDLYPSQKEAYSVDMQAMVQLGQNYLMAGDMDKGMSVMEMVSSLAQEMADQIYANPQTGEMMQQLAEQEKMIRAQQEQMEAVVPEEEQHQQQKSPGQSMGKSRDDLDRFTGLYTDPNDANRTLFVTISCDGYLVTGPMWADVSPWWMHSAEATVFTYSDSFMSFSMRFETDDGAGVHIIRHDIDGVGSPVTRSGPLPGDWEACVERPGR